MIARPSPVPGCYTELEELVLLEELEELGLFEELDELGLFEEPELCEEPELLGTMIGTVFLLFERVEFLLPAKSAGSMYPSSSLGKKNGTRFRDGV